MARNRLASLSPCATRGQLFFEYRLIARQSSRPARAVGRSAGLAITGRALLVMAFPNQRLIKIQRENTAGLWTLQALFMQQIF